MERGRGWGGIRGGREGRGRGYRWKGGEREDWKKPTKTKRPLHVLKATRPLIFLSCGLCSPQTCPASPRKVIFSLSLKAKNKIKGEGPGYQGCHGLVAEEGKEEGPSTILSQEC